MKGEKCSSYATDNVADTVKGEENKILLPGISYTGPL